VQGEGKGKGKGKGNGNGKREMPGFFAALRMTRLGEFAAVRVDRI
jgi:hypothetical protein